MEKESDKIKRKLLRFLGVGYLFLGFIDLSKPNLILAFLAGLTQFFQTKMLIPKITSKDKTKEAGMSQMMQKQMMYFLPIFTVIILTRIPAALGLYWTVSGIFSIIQQYFIIRKNQELTLTPKNQHV